MKEIDRYHMWVEWSDEDGVYIGRCPDLISGIHADDPVVLYKELRELVEEIIEDHRSEGWALPPPTVHPSNTEHNFTPKAREEVLK